MERRPRVAEITLSAATGMRERYRPALTPLTAFPGDRSPRNMESRSRARFSRRAHSVRRTGASRRQHRDSPAHPWLGRPRHHLDPAYDAVVLHLVGDHDGTETRRLDRGHRPRRRIGPIDRFAVPEFAAWDWQLSAAPPVPVVSRLPARLQPARSSFNSATCALPRVPPGSRVAYRWSRLAKSSGKSCSMDSVSR